MSEPIALPYTERDVPHIVIEVNQKCNISCRGCYKNRYNYTKPLQLITEEIDLAVDQRALDVITLAGGEPTLHPELEAIIAYIRKKGLRANMLSNGVTLNDERLAQLKRAGLNRIMLHIDSFQRRPDVTPGASEQELNALRDEIAARIVAHGISCGLSLILYRENLPSLADLVDYAQSSRNISLLLVTCYTDTAAIGRTCGVRPWRPKSGVQRNAGQCRVTIDEIERCLHRSLDISPFLYLPSNLRHEDKRWVLYESFSITSDKGTCSTLALSSKHGHLMRAINYLQRTFRRRYAFDVVLSPAGAVLSCLLYGLLSFDWRMMLKVIKFLSQLLRGNHHIGFNCLVFQQGPSVTAQGQLEYCKHCPDATVRNGKIIPLCLADVFSPLPAAAFATPCATPACSPPVRTSAGDLLSKRQQPVAAQIG